MQKITTCNNCNLDICIDEKAPIDQIEVSIGKLVCPRCGEDIKCGFVVKMYCDRGWNIQELINNYYIRS